MKAVYNDSSTAEKEAKRRYHFPENLMMENAAAAMEKAVWDSPAAQNHKNLKILIACGSGNNGGDGLALARRLCGNASVLVLLYKEPKTPEAKLQFEMAQASGVEFITEPENLKIFKSDEFDIIADCLFGTGFKGEPDSKAAEVISKLNAFKAWKIACDIPSALVFRADVTVTMGALKTILFNDKAKACTGRILTAPLGITDKKFEECAEPDAFLIEKQDCLFPFRKNPATHKGSFGHTAVIAGEKSGAAIIAAEAALEFGSGLTTLVKTKTSNLEQFKISPALMLSNQLPNNTTALLLGSGLGTPSEELLNTIVEFLKNAKTTSCPPGLVLDADMFTYTGLASFLEKLLEVKNLRIILTPHPKELSSLCRLLEIGEYTTAQAAENRMKIAQKISQKYPPLTVIMKSANTFILASKTEQEAEPLSEKQKASSKSSIFICADGAQSLSKGGSGDVLAGLCASLLAQGYSAKQAAITATEAHALAGKSFSNGQGWDLSPEKLIHALNTL